MSSTVPRDEVAYYIQNQDYGTCIGVTDDFPITRTERVANLVARYRKEGVKTQHVCICSMYRMGMCHGETHLVVF